MEINREEPPMQRRSSVARIVGADSEAEPEDFHKIVLTEQLMQGEVTTAEVFTEKRIKWDSKEKYFSLPGAWCCLTGKSTL